MTLPTSFSARTAAIVGSVMGVTHREVFSHTRQRRVTHARQAAMFLAREVKGLSLNTLGRQFERDHTTVLHAISEVRKRIALDPEFASRMSVLLEEVRAMAAADTRSMEERRITNAMALPMRITTTQVCDLAGFGPQTLTKRVNAGTMPKPIDHARERLFDRDEVLVALGILKVDAPEVASW